MRFLIGITGASGVIYGVEFLKKCPGEKFLILSEWGEKVLEEEAGLREKNLKKWVKKIYTDRELASPFASGSNLYDAMIVIPCSLSSLAKIAYGIGDTLLTRAAQVVLKERRKLILAIRETPLSSIALENALKLSREGVIIMPISPPMYPGAKNLTDVINNFLDKVLALLGVKVKGYRKEELF